jgi:hypothetical protein
MVGYALEGGKVRVALSDGRWVTREDGLTRVTKTYCIVQGRVYRCVLWMSSCGMRSGRLVLDCNLGKRRPACTERRNDRYAS